MNQIPGIASIFLVLTLGAAALADPRLVRDEDGITVHEEGGPGRTLPILTAVTFMAASPEQIHAWIRATPTHTEWMHDTEEARALSDRDGVQIVYNRIATPWPVSDRDVVLRSRRTQLEGGGIRVDFEKTEELDVEAVDTVRMNRLEGYYEMRPVDGGTRVEYRVDSDPGGRLPSWLVTRASKNLPFFTLRNLRERAEAGLPPE
jgi:hypothetical protein